MKWYDMIYTPPGLHGHAQGDATDRSRDSDRIFCVIKWGPGTAHLQRNNSKVWNTRMHLCQFIGNKKKCLHIKKFISTDSPTWPQFNVFGTPLYLPWRPCGKQWSLYLLCDQVFTFGKCYLPTCCFSSSTLVIKSFTFFRVPERRENHWKTYAMLHNFRIVFAVLICSVRPSIKWLSKSSVFKVQLSYNFCNGWHWTPSLFYASRAETHSDFMDAWIHCRHLK